MIRRIAVVFLVYILGIFILSRLGNNVFYMLFLSIYFFIYMIWELFNYYNGDWKKNNEILFANLQEDIDIAKLKKISSRPFLFGLEGRFISDESFYFDDDNLYIIAKNRKTVKVPFEQITELKKTSMSINKIRIRQISVGIEGAEAMFRFANNYTIWNKNFKEFYTKLSRENPMAVKTKWSYWNL